MPKTVILIISHKPKLSSREKISIRQCCSILHKHDCVFIFPESLDVSDYGEFKNQIAFDFIPAHWQSTYENFARLKILPFLYKRYRKYDYILFYEPDAFVFRDDLDFWMSTGYDYIGAPWLERLDRAELDARFFGVGNGGFSLRKVSSALKALNRFSYLKRPTEVFQTIHGFRGAYHRRCIWRAFLNLTVRNNTFHLFNDYPSGEDTFWCRYVGRNFSWFRIPDEMTALKFSFEVQPRRMFELNGGQLPFGCHAWWRYDLDFWKPHIEAFGHKI